MNETPRSRTNSLGRVLHWLLVLFIFFYVVIPNILEPRWRTANESYVAEWPLPDGKHKLRLLKVEKGLKTYDWVPSLNSPWLEAVFSRPKYPSEIHLKSKVKYPSDWESFGFLFRVVDNNGRWDHYSYSIDQVRLKDSQGYAVGDYSNTTRESGVILLETTWIPRRDKELTIQIEKSDYPNPLKVYDFKMPNPFHGENFPIWQADPSGSTKTAGGRTVKLVGPSGHGSTYSLMERVDPISNVVCESVITLEDPTGNRGHTLSPFEPVWKIQADAFPRLQQIAPESIRYSRVLNVPPVSNTVPLNESIAVREATVKLLALCGGGTVSNLGVLPYEYPLRSQSSDNEPFVVVQAENIRRDNGIAIRMTFRGGQCGKTLSYRDNEKPIAIPISTWPQVRPRAFTLEIADSSTQRFEFLIEPAKENDRNAQ